MNHFTLTHPDSHAALTSLIRLPPGCPQEEAEEEAVLRDMVKAREAAVTVSFSILLKTRQKVRPTRGTMFRDELPGN